MKEYIVYFRSRYYPMEGLHKKKVWALNKRQIRDCWHSIILTDEYVIKKIEEVK